MILHTDLRSDRWPWLTQGWEIAEEVDLKKQSEYFCKLLTSDGLLPQFFDSSYFYHPYVPELIVPTTE